MKRRAFIGGMAAILTSRRAPAFCIALRNGMMRPSAPPTPPLPYDAEVEYLESTGTQVIDLGFKGSNGTSFDIIMYRPSNSDTVSFGTNSGWGRKTLYFVTGNGWLYWMYGASVGSTYVSSSSYLVGNLRFFSVGNNVLNAENLSTGNSYSKESTGSTPFTTDWNLCLIGTSENGSYGYSGAGTRIYYAKVDDGDNHVELIPVRKNGVGYMYDRISGDLFANAGTGAFLYGPDK